MKTAIIIPARFESTRLPGKPLIMIKGLTMLQRVVRISQIATEGLTNTTITVATDDQRILDHCQEMEVNAVMTSPDLPTGTDRVAEAVKHLPSRPDLILNMQGDAPFTPPHFLRAMIDAFAESPCDAITPVTQLSWQQLDNLRKNKLTTPFSGTTALFNQNTGNALWFSKNILPAIRKENELRTISHLSPVYRHIGLYGYSYNMLQAYIQLPESHFEKLEGLEQLRLLENGYTIRCVPVSLEGFINMSGIDSPEDVKRAEALLAEQGDLLQ